MRGPAGSPAKGTATLAYAATTGRPDACKRIMPGELMRIAGPLRGQPAAGNAKAGLVWQVSLPASPKALAQRHAIAKQAPTWL
jgi:hypothetical protein